MDPRLIIKRTFDISPDPEELGRCFAAMASDDQARFFRHVALCVDVHDYNMPMQVRYLADDLLRRAWKENDEFAQSAIHIIDELANDLRDIQETP